MAQSDGQPRPSYLRPLLTKGILREYKCAPPPLLLYVVVDIWPVASTTTRYNMPPLGSLGHKGLDIMKCDQDGREQPVVGGGVCSFCADFVLQQ